MKQNEIVKLIDVFMMPLNSGSRFKDSFPDGTEIRCVNFGSPPVFKSNTDENADSDNCDNIYREEQ